MPRGAVPARAGRRRPLPARRFGLVVVCVVLSACGAEAPPGRSEDTPAAEAAAPDEIWHEGPRLPAPVAGNVVAALRGPVGLTVVSFLGIDSTRTPGGVTAAAYRWDFDSGGGWREIAPVPGPGRLAATAQALAGRVFVFGGYTVAEDGSRTTTLPDVAVYDVGTDAWGWAADIPVPVGGAVSGVWARSMIYLMGGRHDGATVADVQLFDPSINRWSSVTPIPGAPVLGHAGGIVGDDIVYVGGAEVVAGHLPPAADTGAWHGRIDVTDPTRIDWRPIADPPGLPLYGAAGAAAGGMVIVAGGSDDPHDLDGVGADGTPAQPVHRLLGYDPRVGWVQLPPPPVATMDHRSLAVAGGRVFLVGGMLGDRRVSDRVWYADVDALLAATRER